MNNFVAKYARDFNKSAVHVDRKKKKKRETKRKMKHKGKSIDY